MTAIQERLNAPDDVPADEAAVEFVEIAEPDDLAIRAFFKGYYRKRSDWRDRLRIHRMDAAGRLALYKSIVDPIDDNAAA